MRHPEQRFDANGSGSLRCSVSRISANKMLSIGRFLARSASGNGLAQSLGKPRALRPHAAQENALIEYRPQAAARLWLGNTP